MHTLDRKPTATEALRNLLFKYNGTAIPGIHPKRLAILAAVQEAKGWTDGRDDAAIYAHLRAIGSI
jgi:hypothetical protein